MIATASLPMAGLCPVDDATLLLIDDHPVFHTGLLAMLNAVRPGWRLVSACDAAAGIASAAAAAPEIDLVLIDLTLQSGDGFLALAEFGHALPATPRVVISGREDVTARLRARQLGASGFIAKAWSGERIALAIDRVLAGETSFDEPARMASGPTLSSRQMEVLMLLAEGLPNKTIELRMGIAERTVRAHLTELFHVLNARNRTQALVQAQKLGLIA